MFLASNFHKYFTFLCLESLLNIVFYTFEKKQIHIISIPLYVGYLYLGALLRIKPYLCKIYIDGQESGN